MNILLFVVLGFNSGARRSLLAWWTHQISLSERGVSPPVSPIMPTAPIIPVQRHMIESLTPDDIKELA
ncbi:hypothetical protein IE4872_PD00382 (plasmid) [Rhizobium gallicum]|uniref:Uncharacterized protein n=1 Tax=Rhizobium gallicum TaxID=56730 RepID=A0A1L5NSN6_9HYPH|nr:hypothetical protein IE4872_PD00382 [Rhizobium gallicum]